MLTRLEVDGFKNLLDFGCYFGPYTCVAGPNSVGKSNLFDAIEFLSLLADTSFLDATQRLRGRDGFSPDPRSLFWNNAESADPVIRLAAEMIVPATVEDDFGRAARPTTTFLRYELALRYVPGDAQTPETGGIRLEREELTYIQKGEARSRLPWPHSAGRFRDHVVSGRRFGSAYISTTAESGEQPVVQIHQDGGSRGKPMSSNPSRAPRTVVSTTTSADDPTILAARREMSRWHQLALEPSAMRSSDRLADSARVTPSGAHLAAALYRLARERGQGVYAEVAAEAADLTDVRDLQVDYDRRRDSLTLLAQLGAGPLLPARSLSDGTLRFLALCVLRAEADEAGGRLFCLEEPENGIHPGRIEAMVDLTKALAVDPEASPGPDNPLRQVIVNTHSPRFVQAVAAAGPGDILAAQLATIRRGGGTTTALRLVPLTGTWRARDESARPIPVEYLIDYGLNENPVLMSSEEA